MSSVAKTTISSYKIWFKYYKAQMSNFILVLENIKYILANPSLLKEDHYCQPKPWETWNKAYLPSSLLFSIKSTLLFALLTGLRRAILLLRVGATLAFCANKCCNNVTILTRLGLKKKKKSWTEVNRFIFSVMNTDISICIMMLQN